LSHQGSNLAFRSPRSRQWRGAGAAPRAAAAGSAALASMVALAHAPAADRDPDRPRPAAAGHQLARLVGAVGDDLGPERAPHALGLLGHPLLELGGAAPHPAQLLARPLELLLELEHGLDARQVEPLLGGHPLDAAQPLG